MERPSPKIGFVDAIADHLPTARDVGEDELLRYPSADSDARLALPSGRQSESAIRPEQSRCPQNVGSLRTETEWLRCLDRRTAKESTFTPPQSRPGRRIGKAQQLTREGP